MENPYSPPQSEIVAPPAQELAPEYAGFWIRLGALFIDGLIIMAISTPILIGVYGTEYYSDERFLKGGLDFVVRYVFPFIWVILFWAKKGATPGKMAVKVKIVNADGSFPSVGQCIGRYFAYAISGIPLGLGYLWAAWDPQKQTWHDKLANTYVVRVRS